MIFLGGRSVTDRRVHNMAEAPAPAGFVSGAGAWIESVSITVDGEKENVRRFVENVLGSVAVVHVPVDDQNAVHLVDIERMPGGESYVVEKTEAHAFCRRGMMTRRADQA